VSRKARGLTSAPSPQVVPELQRDVESDDQPGQESTADLAKELNIRASVAQPLATKATAWEAKPSTSAASATFGAGPARPSGGDKPRRCNEVERKTQGKKVQFHLLNPLGRQS